MMIGARVCVRMAEQYFKFGCISISGYIENDFKSALIRVYENHSCMQCKLLTLNLLVGGEIQSEVGKKEMHFKFHFSNFCSLFIYDCIQTLLRESCYLKKKSMC